MAQPATQNRTTGHTPADAALPAGTRSRTHTWEPPKGYATAGGLTGIELARMSLDGRLPEAPICGTLGFRLVEAEEGLAVFEGEPGEHLFNPMGTVHGGYMATILDSALGTAVLTALPRSAPKILHRC
jgi:hypothetical protein